MLLINNVTCRTGRMQGTLTGRLGEETVLLTAARADRSTAVLVTAYRAQRTAAG